MYKLVVQQSLETHLYNPKLTIVRHSKDSLYLTGYTTCQVSPF